jgi:uncharacterized phage-associated protein
MNCQIDKAKAHHIILYVVSNLGHKADLYKSLKIIFAADKLHLEKYGRTISGDSYINMSKGPVPSYIYDLTKPDKNGGLISFKNDYTLIANAEFDIDEFSDSDIEILDQIIEEYRPLNKKEVEAKSHGYAYLNTVKNKTIPFHIFATEAGLNEASIDYVLST